MSRTGGCLCGAVRYRIAAVPDHADACHCGMCRKWSGGVFLAVAVAPGDLIFENEDNLACYPSSDWAERAFCKTCGSSLFYRLTVPGPHRGACHVGIGSLDDPSDLPLVSEIFIDEKPDGYAFAGETRKMTAAEVMAMFAPGPDA